MRRRNNLGDDVQKMLRNKRAVAFVLLRARGRNPSFLQNERQEEMPCR